MNWEAVGALGEILGAVAVVATLLYLSIQVRQNSLLQREDARYHMLQNQLSWLDGMLQHPDVMRAHYGIDEDDVEGTAAMRSELWTQGSFIRWQWEYLRQREGIFALDDVPVAAFRAEFDGSPILARQWHASKQWLDPDFVRFMEAKVIPASAPDES